MKCFIVLSALVAVTLARPGNLVGLSHQVSQLAPLAYAAPHNYVRLVSGAPIGVDGRVVDTLEVAHAKAEHAAAHDNEKVILAKEALNSADYLSYAPLQVASYYKTASVPLATSSYHASNSYQSVAPVAYAYEAKLVPSAPIGIDGRVVDTAEVAYAKAEHAAAHINEKVNLANEAAKNYVYSAPQVQLAYSVDSYAPKYLSSAVQW